VVFVVFALYSSIVSWLKKYKKIWSTKEIYKVTPFA
jgi:hypothetical protein